MVVYSCAHRSGGRRRVPVTALTTATSPATQQPSATIHRGNDSDDALDEEEGSADGVEDDGDVERIPVAEVTTEADQLVGEHAGGQTLVDHADETDDGGEDGHHEIGDDQAGASGFGRDADDSRGDDEEDGDPDW